MPLACCNFHAHEGGKIQKFMAGHVDGRTFRDRVLSSGGEPFFGLRLTVRLIIIARQAVFPHDPFGVLDGS